MFGWLPGIIHVSFHLIDREIVLLILLFLKLIVIMIGRNAFSGALHVTVRSQRHSAEGC